MALKKKPTTPILKPIIASALIGASFSCIVEQEPTMEEEKNWDGGTGAGSSGTWDDPPGAGSSGTWDDNDGPAGGLSTWGGTGAGETGTWDDDFAGFDGAGAPAPEGAEDDVPFEDPPGAGAQMFEPDMSPPSEGGAEGGGAEGK